jgi:protocatechuate 3,4-dioxygenase beta subunit
MQRLVLSLLSLFVAVPALAGSLRVSDRAGKPVEGAIVRSLGDPAAAPVTSDAEGGVEAPAGLLRIEASGFLPFEGPASGTVVLTRPSSVVVRIVEGETGAAVGSGRVRLWLLEGDPDAARALGPAPEEPPLQESPLVEGRADFRGLTSGTYRVQVEADGFLALGRAVAPAPEAEDELSVRLMAASVVEGRVLAGGKAVAAARLRVLPGLPEQMARGAGRRGGRGGPGGMFRALSELSAIEVTSDAQGRFRFDQLPAERRFPFVLVAQAPDFSWGFAQIPTTGRGAVPATAAERTLALDVLLDGGTAVSGRAVWGDGRPAVGVSVVAELEQEMRGWGGTRRVGVSLAPIFEEWGGGPEEVTGPDGEFTLRGLPPANWRLVARPFEHAPSDPLELELLPGEAPPGPVLIEIATGLSIEGVIVDPSGNPVADAEIVGEITREGGRWPEQQLDTMSDAKGRFSIAGFDPGTLVLRVNAAGFGNKRVEVGPVEEASGQRIEMTRTGGLFGVALNAASGEPLTRFRVTAVQAEEDGSSSPMNRFRGRRPGPEIVSEDGSFELNEIKEGRWAVLVRAEGYITRVSEATDVRAGDVSDVGRVELAPGAVVTGRVEDGDGGEPIVGATVTVQGIDGSGSGRFRFQRRGWGGGQAPTDTTGADGEFRLDGLPPGEFTVTASHHAYPMRAEHSERISVGDDPASELPPLVLRMERGGTVAGRVLDSSGEGVAGAVVVAVEPGARGRGSVVGGPIDADETGAFAIEALPAGEVLVRRADRMDGGVKARVIKGEVAEVTLQDQGARVFGGIFVAGRPVEGRVRLLAGTWGAPRTDWGSSYELPGVPPGEWTLRVDLRDDADPTAPVREERVKITVPEDLRELQFDIRLETEDTSDDTVVEGRVVDVDTGEGLSGWLITARKSGGGRETTRTDGEGVFRITLTEAGEWQVAALATSSDPPYDAPSSVVVATENGRLLSEPPLFEAKRKIELKVRVVDVAGTPVQGATCALINKARHLNPQSGLQRIGPSGTSTDALGRTTVSATEPGRQDLLVVLPARALVFRIGVQVGSTVEVDVQLPRTGTLEIRGARQADLLGLPGGWWMRLRAGQDRYSLLETRGDTLLLHGLPAGGYQVRVDGRVRDAEILPGTASTIVDFSD